VGRPEKPRLFRPLRGAFTSGFQTRQRPTVVVTDDDVEPTNTSEDEDEDDLHEPDDETEADIEIVPDLLKTANRGSVNSTCSDGSCIDRR
jgi:hypothetical protein